MSQYSVPEILYKEAGDEDKIMESVYKSKNYQITISRYFDALRFAQFDSIVFYSFVDVPRFIESCPDTHHRLALLADDDYFKIRN